MKWRCEWIEQERRVCASEPTCQVINHGIRGRFPHAEGYCARHGGIMVAELAPSIAAGEFSVLPAARAPAGVTA